MLIISAGLQKSGSALMFNMINDILVFNKKSDVRELKRIHRLDQLLQYHNCNISDLSWSGLKKLLFLSLHKTFVVKTHAGPTRLLKFLLKRNLVRCILIIRDPRDVIISAMDHGRKLREEGRSDTFATCRTVEETVAEVRQWVRTILPWSYLKNTLVVRYEDLIGSQEPVLRKVAAFLNCTIDRQFLETLVHRYDAGNPDEAVRNILHYNKAVSNRYRDIFSTIELSRINHELKVELEALGYHH